MICLLFSDHPSLFSAGGMTGGFPLARSNSGAGSQALPGCGGAMVCRWAVDLNTKKVGFIHPISSNPQNFTDGRTSNQSIDNGGLMVV